MKLLRGKDEIQAAFERLGRLTKDEGLAANAQTLRIAFNLADNDPKKMKRLFFPPYLLLPRLTVSY